MKIGIKKTYSGILDVPARKLKGVEVRHILKPAGTVLASTTMRTTLYGQQGEQLTFDEPTVWHELSETGVGVWMTDYPIEQRQTDELIVRSRGRVLVGGLGLGYAVIALAARSKVQEIVVVERNPVIIKLVWDATVARIRTLFPKRKVKLTVVEADLFDYLTARQAEKDGKPEFSWGLFDIWQGDGETTFHETVVPLRALAHGVVASVVCWNEDVMRGQLYQGLVARLMMLRNPALFDVNGIGVTLDDLTKDSDSVYQQWAVPFWRWFKDHAYLENGDLDEELVQLVLRLYVKTYGRPEALNGLPALRPYRTVTKVDSAEAEGAATT